MPERELKVGFIQNDPRILRVRENLEACVRMMERSKADLWVLPEFFATGYHFKDRREVKKVAENFPGGETCGVLRAVARKMNCAVIGGFVERSGSRFYNSAFLVSPAGSALYRKTHLFGREKLFFSPGDTGFGVHRIFGAKVGIMICFDWFFPEAARTLALKGAELIAHPSNLVLPWGPEAMKVRSLENRVYSVTANRVGLERGLRFIGQSQIAAPDGKILVRAAADQPGVRVRTLDLAAAREKKITVRNHLLRDRRPRFYGITG